MTVKTKTTSNNSDINKQVKLGLKALKCMNKLVNTNMSKTLTALFLPVHLLDPSTATPLIIFMSLCSPVVHVSYGSNKATNDAVKRF